MISWKSIAIQCGGRRPGVGTRSATTRHKRPPRPGTRSAGRRPAGRHRRCQAGVTVVARNEGSGQYRETLSRTDGSFSMTALTPGLYEVTATRSGCKSFQRGGVRVEVGGAVAIALQLQGGGIEEQVTVTAETPLVDFERSGRCSV